MATYYKYAERSAEDYVDWGAIGKTMSDTLLKEQENRDKMKADIDKASREFGEVLSNAPQGSHRGLNEYAQEFGSNAQEYQLMQLKNLKAGKLSLKDYLVGRENVKQGANDAFDLIKKYNDAFTENDQRLNDGISSRYETFMLGEVEGFGNLTSTSLYINPTDGKVSAGKRALRDPSKPYDPTTNPYTAQMSSDPNDFRSLVDLNFALSAKIDKYDSKGTISSIAETFADTYETITEKGARGAYTKVSDIRNLGKEGEEFKAALQQKLRADFRTNKIHTISALVDWLKVGPDGEEISFTRNPEEANEHTILLKANPEQPEGGTDIMDEDAPGAQKLLDHLMEQAGNSVMSELNSKVTVQAGRAPVRATRDDYARADKRRSDKENVNLLADLYYGTDAEIDTALTNLRGTQTVHGPIDKIVRNETGVSIIAGGKTIPFNFGKGDKRKTPTEFVEGISSEFGIDFSTAVRGANIQNKAFNKTAKLESTVTVALSPEQAAIQAFNKLAQEMSSQGYDFATKLGYDVAKVTGGYKLTKGENSKVVKQSSKAIIDYIKTDILNDELLDFYNRGVIVGKSEGNSMEDY